MAIEKIKILGALLELSAKQHCQFWPIRPNFEVNGLDWQCCLAGSSQRAPRIFIFSIVLDAENLSYVKSIETHACAFLTLNILSMGSVHCFVTSSNTSRLEPHPGFYRLLMKGIFVAYVE